MLLELSAQAFHEAWEHFGMGTKPITLNVLPTGVLESERRAAEQRAWDELRALGFGDRDREDDLHDTFLPLHRYDTAFDLTYRRRTTTGHASLSGLVGQLQTRATLALRDENRVRLRVTSADAAVQALLAILPDVRPGPGRAVSVRAAILDDAAARAGRNDRVMADELLRAGVRRDDARTLVDMAGRPRIAFAQCGAAVLNDRGKRLRVSMVTNCFATQHGWYLLEESRRTGEPWVTVAPIDREQLSVRVHDLRNAVVRE